MKWKLIVIITFVITIGSSCSSTSSSKWPSGMTPFFAECPYGGGVFTGKAYHQRKKSPCKAGWKFYDRGEPTLTNDLK